MPNPYETERYVNEYLLFHYGAPSNLCPFNFVPKPFLRFHERIRAECLLPIKPSKSPTNALDIGCAVGRFTFELASVVDEALGIDNSKHFIQAARRLVRNPTVAIKIKESGSGWSNRSVGVPRPLRGANVRFEVGDALALPDYGEFDIVAALNLLCRLPAPRKFLQQVCAFLKPGGQLILSSPFSWLQEYTPRRAWLTSAQVEACLRPELRLVRRRDLPFLIREHRRKYQLVVAEVMTFQKF
jgi:SAM-dependent methyltransferase